MSTNLTVESPAFDKIADEAGNFTADAIGLLWAALNDTRATMRRETRRAQDVMEPKDLALSAAASVDNLDITGYSTIEFTGASAQNFTGLRAPETSRGRIVLVHVSGAGTITMKNSATSETANQIVTTTGADVSLTTGKGAVLKYAQAKWRQVV